MLDAAQAQLPLFDDGALAAPVTSGPAARRRRTSKAAPASAVPGDARERRALRQAFLGLAASWSLSGREVLTLLGEPGADEVERHERMRDLAGIRRSLQILVPGRETARSYLERPDPDLDGGWSLGLMLEGGHAAIVRVRRHLAARVASLP